MRVSNVTVRKRLLFVLLFGVIVFLIIDTRLGYVQFVMGEKLTSLAKDSWSRNLPFEPERGEILDRNGVKLATNKSAPTVFVVLAPSSESDENEQATCGGAQYVRRKSI